VISPIKQEKFSQNIHTSVVEDWLNNTNFDYEASWVHIEQGDISDVDGFIGQGYGNYLVYGDFGVMRIDDPLNNGDWGDFNNPEFPISPDTNGSSSAGLNVTHLWDEGVDQTRNTPSIHWKQNVTMPVNMSDYVITSASLTAIFNATVTVSPHDGGGIDCPGDPGDTPLQFGVGDSATFYVLISDLENENSYQVAINKTSDLGQDSPQISSYPDTPMDVVPEEVLISYLTSILEKDNFNFTITLGIDIYCEDNEYWTDEDSWDSLIMRSFNLTFTYKKKIDQFTTISWEQVGNQISGNDTQITNAQLNFEYKINQTWPYSSSPNSEIRVFINNKMYNETIKLSGDKQTLQDAFQDDIDVTSFISKDVNITLSIQVYLADEFELDNDIMISIDDVFFQITYVEITSETSEEPFISRILLIIASIIGLIIASYLIAYQKILKYPKPVRKVRKFKRTLRKGKPSVEILDRKKSFEKEFKKELHNTSSYLRGKPTGEVTPIKEIKKIEPNQISELKKSPQGDKNL